MQQSAFEAGNNQETNLNIFAEIKSLLEQDEWVLFSGTPCQVAAIKSYLRSCDTSKLLLADMLCHGTPSPKLMNDYFDYIERKQGQRPVKHLHRCKATGWNHTEANVFPDGKIDYQSFDSQVHKNVFYSHVGLRPSCHNCKYAARKRAGDITMADFWGIEKLHPEFYDTRGVSLLLVNTTKGADMFSAMEKDYACLPAAIGDALSTQPHLSRSAAIHPQRAEFWNEYRSRGYKSAIKKYANCGTKQRTKYNVVRFTKATGIHPYLKRVKSALKGAR